MSRIEVPNAVIQQAIEWMVQLHSGEMTQEELAAFQRWRSLHSSHNQACAQIEESLGRMPHLAAQPALRETLKRGSNRREFLRMALTIAAVASTSGWVYNRRTPLAGLFADLHTDTGERRTEHLMDGTVLTLNARTRLNLDFDETRRNIRLLSGQIYIDALPSKPPVFVTTAEGQINFNGGIVTVAAREGVTHVAALKQTAQVSTRQSTTPLLAGNGALISSQGIALHQISSDSESAWINGFVEIDNQPLGTLIEALRSYRTGIIRLSAQAAQIRVSGIFPLDNTDFALEAVAQTLPVVVSRTTAYWVSISAA